MAFSFFASPVAQARLSSCGTSSAQCPTMAPSRAEKASHFFKGKSEFRKSKCTFEYNLSSFSVMAVATPTKSQVPQIATGSLVVADDKTVSPATVAFRQKAEALYRYAQDTVVAGLEEVDGVKLRTDFWKRTEGGGGVTKVLQGGNVFEKAGVNVSVVYGTMPPEAVRAASVTHKAGQSKEDVSFFATGISSVIHPWNPMAPTMHFNYRYFETCSKEGGEPDFWWFGGGIDLTPSYIFNEDVTHFHRTMKDACDKHDPEYYPKFKKWCDEYFLIKHRGERRGLGGIFFDDLNDRSREEIIAFQESCVEAIVPAYAPIVQKRKNLPFNDEQKRWQQLRRGKYAEFNLVYDRGTVFGLKTGGRTESILMSLPLTARWEYDYQPEAGTPEADLLDACRNPREWI